MSEPPPLIRDAGEWAREWGYVPPRRAANLARRCRELAEAIEGALADDEGAKAWADELRKIARLLEKRPQ